MREIKFRAFIYGLADEDSHPLEIDIRAGKLWDVASINFKDQIVEIMDDDGNVWEYELNDEIALVQYTGEKDINGKEIYGGYIVRFAVPNPTGYESYDGEWVDTTEQEPCGEVVFKDGCYCVKYPNGELLPFNTPTSETNKAPIIELFEVIGNIYENKELLDE